MASTMVNNSSLKNNKYGSSIITAKIMDCQTWWGKESTLMKILIKTHFFICSSNFRPAAKDKPLQ